ncbi:glycosyltransferase family 4 protein [Emticicia sp. BO119]|uniref:glycosyltransferase family 4 protein n=1 Tax=Emticicia sp. BO119 TaxID=2757768 RepID=UPI0015F06A82|nr:glycosyltransferase family 4 protein [Emticicia sp. BO119]MBA4853954.1 glycosyltransferase family 4 protein [Emticicia sp. BO119]
MKTILILTQYFPPEVGAPQNRLWELANFLSQKEFDVTVLTALPNYPEMKIHKEFRNKFIVRKKVNQLTIIHSWIYVPSKKTFFKRLLNYFSFVFSSVIACLFLRKKYDYILCESPPLFLGISAIFLSWLKKSKLIFNVSDLWPETAEKLGLVTNKFLLKYSIYLEEYIYKKSDYITGQTQGIVKNIKDRFPDKKIFWLKNGVNLLSYKNKYVLNDWRREMGISKDFFLLLYAGIIGHAQGLEVILKAANLLGDYSKIKFFIVGEGPEKDSLISIKEKLQLENVVFLNGQKKDKMYDILNAINASIVPLRKIDLFKGAIPSKIFENLVTKKPILLGVDGEAKEIFAVQGQCALYFEPENEIELKEQIINLYNNTNLQKELGENGLKLVKLKFDRNIIAQDFIDFILE